MESLSPQVVAAAKLPILNPNEFDLWKMRIEQYFLMTHYSLWEVILNGDSPILTGTVDDVVQVIAPTTRNKANLKDQSLDNLFNNLKIYEANVKSSSSTSHNTQNIAFVSSNNTDSTNESVSIVPSVSTASIKAPVFIISNVDSLSDAVIYSFFAIQSNSPQLDNEDLKQIDANDFKEIDLKWQMVMLTMRAKWDPKTKDTQRRTVPVETSTSNSLVSEYDGVGSYDWSFQADEEPTIYVLMAFTSSSSSSSSGSDNENENVFKDDIKLLKLDVMLRDNALVELRKKFEKAKKEKDDSESDDSVPTSPVHDTYESGESEIVPNMFKVEPSTTKPIKEMSQSNRPSAPIIEDWVSDSEDESEGNPQQDLKDKVVIDSGCSRHMTGNISYLSDFEEINGGYVALGGNPKGGKIICKGKIKIGKLDFDDVYFVKDPKFNLFSVLEMCDKKNIVLFTDTECVFLSFDFKLPDENHVLLRVLRENNMYNVDLKIVVPSGDLTCLFVKATLDESNLWHRRLGHINFKTMNKLVKGNLVRGLPSKVFENNHTCVACKKGNQPNHSADPQNTDADAAFDVKEKVSEVHVSPSSSDKPKKHDEKDKREAKGKSLVDLSIGVRDLRDEFEEFSINSTNRVNAASTPVTIVGPNTTNSTTIVNAASPFDNAVSPHFEIGGKSSFVDPSQFPDDPDMPALEDIVYSNNEEDVGAEADFSNLKQIYLSSDKEYVKDGKRTSAFLYGTIEEEVYVCQPLGFKDPDYPDKVYKMVKALYGLHQAPRAWYETLVTYLLENGFQRGKIDHALFIKKQKGDILLIQQKDDGTFISQDKYVAKILRKFGLTHGKSASTPIDTEKPLLKDPNGEDVDVHIYRYLKGKPHLGLWYPKDSPFNLVAYSDSEYAGASLDRKSTTGGCQFLGYRLISWKCKKQTVIATSSTEAKYVAAASCYAQVLWI
uniref:Putative ribonuclease H-like domain-containing protein n=1 Tax=Tanacetum cinerariifolium TaxID=118510 RepID=A0A6L2MLL2_TANCI|nr:putative ribonuclease H-like domain-containing protein [Tanacetum cinerariifolium]